jgi:hypothetical protein
VKDNYYLITDKDNISINWIKPIEKPCVLLVTRKGVNPIKDKYNSLLTNLLLIIILIIKTLILNNNNNDNNNYYIY